MGADKALISLGGRPLVEWAVGILQGAGLAVGIAGAQISLEGFAPVIADAEKGLGPLSGICGALASARTRFAVFLSVDLPLLPASLVSYLVRHAEITESAVTVPSVCGFAQTFPAVIDRAALATLQAELAARRLGCFAAFETAAAALDQEVEVIPVEHLVQARQVAHPVSLPCFLWFLNVNTPEDLEQAASFAGRGIA